MTPSTPHGEEVHPAVDARWSAGSAGLTPSGHRFRWVRRSAADAPHHERVRRRTDAERIAAWPTAHRSHRKSLRTAPARLDAGAVTAVPLLGRVPGAAGVPCGSRPMRNAMKARPAHMRPNVAYCSAPPRSPAWVGFWPSLAREGRWVARSTTTVVGEGRGRADGRGRCRNARDDRQHDQQESAHAPIIVAPPGVPPKRVAFACGCAQLRR